jgi:UDP-N-acetylmuramoyl-tripeptide--D-alanyl-D-alanine ligase
MKPFLRSTAARFLALAARGVLRRYHPTIVMVTGSVGKTSTKDAVAAVLSTRFFVRKSEKSFNSDFGVPFTVLGVKNPWGNPFSWMHVLKEVFALLVLPNHYPNMLVLEVGADRPGDLAHILRIATPDAVVVTRLPEIPVHVEAYTSPEAVREEEFSPAYALSGGAPLIVSSNDPFAMEMAMRVPAHVISYGEGDESQVRISDIGLYEENGMVCGMRAKLQVADEEGMLVTKGTLGRPPLLAMAAAVATGRVFSISLAESITGLEAFTPPAGRGSVLAGKNNSTLIDESYNSSPAAVEEAFRSLKTFPTKGRRIAVLGDMLELGRYSIKEHERIGTLSSRAADVVIGIGVRAKKIVEAAQAAGMSAENAFSFDDSFAAAHTLPTFLQTGDTVLVKGSQSMRMERILEALVADPVNLSKLVRQEPEWKRRA